MATGKQRDGLEPLSYIGVDPVSPPPLFVNTRRPTVHDYKGYDLGSLWLIPSLAEIWVLVEKRNPFAVWVQFYPSGGGSTQFPCDTGTATDMAGTLNLSGSSAVTTAGSGKKAEYDLGSSITIPSSLRARGSIIAGNSVTGGGGVETETLNCSGTDYFKSVGRGVLFANAVGTITGNNGSTNGKVIVSAASAAPQWANLTSSDNSVTINNGANSIDLRITGGGGGGSTGGVAFKAVQSSNTSPFYNFTDEIGCMEALTTIFDQASAFYAGSGAGHGQPGAKYTAPTDGLYHFSIAGLAFGLGGGSDEVQFKIVTPTKTYAYPCTTPIAGPGLNEILCQLTKGDEVTFKLYASSASQGEIRGEGVAAGAGFNYHGFFVQGARIMQL